MELKKKKLWWLARLMRYTIQADGVVEPFPTHAALWFVAVMPVMWVWQYAMNRTTLSLQLNTVVAAVILSIYVGFASYQADRDING